MARVAELAGATSSAEGALMATAQVRKVQPRGSKIARSRVVWMVFAAVILTGAAVDVVLMAVSGMLSGVVDQVAHLSSGVVIGSGVVLLAVAIPGGRWEARRLWQAHLVRVRQRRIVALTPLADLLRVSPLDFGRVTVQTLHDLTPADFERAMGEVLAAHNYRAVERTGGTGDLCADLTAVAPDGKHIVVQCKRYAADHHVTSPEIQQFLGMVLVHHRVPLGLYLTTSSYTPAARKLSQEHHDRLRLLDGEQVVAMVRELAVR